VTVNLDALTAVTLLRRNELDAAVPVPVVVLSDDNLVEGALYL
jgi:hypothetical protein